MVVRNEVHSDIVAALLEEAMKLDAADEKRRSRALRNFSPMASSGNRRHLAWTKSSSLIFKTLKALALQFNPAYKEFAVSVLKSDPGCEEQYEHVDFRSCHSTPPPISIEVALQEGASLKVYPQSHRASAGSFKMEILRPGDVIFFHHQLLHAGASYSTLNYRLHAYAAVDRAHLPVNHTFVSAPDTIEERGVIEKKRQVRAKKLLKSRESH